jgi:putative nucleotidyltransferase with HDIG domain
MAQPAAPVSESSRRELGRRALSAAIAFGFWVATTLVVAVPIGAGTGVNLSVGQSATQDILAPAPISYPSQVLTDRARSVAAGAVADIYDPPDARVARQQVLLLRDVLDYINSVRADSYAVREQQLSDLQAIQSVSLSPDDAQQILAFDNAAWTNVQGEALTVLEQLMRSQVRADQLDEVRRSVPARVSVNLSEAQARIVAALVADLVLPNSFFNDAATQAARQAASAAVAPVYRQIVRGQAVVVRGQVVRAEDIEALQALGLMQPKVNWRQPISGALLTLVSAILLTLYVARFNREFLRSPRRVMLLGLLITVFLLAARFMVPGRTVLPFLFPMAALSMLLTVMAGPGPAVVVTVLVAGLVGYMGGNSLEVALFNAVGGILAVMAVGRGERVNQFFWAGLAVAAVDAAMLLVFHLPDPSLDPLGLLQLLGAALVNGALSASLTLAGFFVLGGVFDITTSLQLIELSRPDHPLLRYILRNAPGTYQHSLQVSNLAEQAAERIGANAMLTRVGALYHDAGKALHPEFFIENQLDSANVHDTLEPEESARIIISHIRDGLEMARRHRLPSQVRAFIPEHHGTLRTMYQYKLALQAAGGDPDKVDASLYTYPGPRPQSRETALLMLADGCEARVRAERPKTEAELDRIVKSVIESRVADGQLDDVDLTLRDLQLIRASFVDTLKGVFHPRIPYPKDEKPALAPPKVEQAPPAAEQTP